MPTTHQVAEELRKLAASLDTQPELEIRRPVLDWYHWSKEDKALFMNLVKVFPRPFDKEYTDTDLNIKNDFAGLKYYARIERSAVCEVVEPAKPAVYRCEPILSDEEESLLEEQ